MCGEDYSVTRGVPDELILAVKKFQNSSEYVLRQNPPTLAVPSHKKTSSGSGNDESESTPVNHQETGNGVANKKSMDRIQSLTTDVVMV